MSVEVHKKVRLWITGGRSGYCRPVPAFPCISNLQGGSHFLCIIAVNKVVMAHRAMLLPFVLLLLLFVGDDFAHRFRACSLYRRGGRVQGGGGAHCRGLGSHGIGFFGKLVDGGLGVPFEDESHVVWDRLEKCLT